ncbi:metallophosphoesterase [Ancylobacter lacus]|uniref:metallophosphoesterase n=1 Tax=Ancylobacter lacus TaxID=2579970 RepID=UPI001BD0FC73|nr:metallophosphoesterase [Ancylobacter lacus]MBS7539996.1 serine/threonine protein phosphatase [Ancylobacter lacus]
MSYLKLNAHEARRIYAIGDIHGRMDLLEKVARSIAADVEAHGGEGALVITLGDVVDRGPHSRAVLDFLSGPRPFAVPYVGLLGNHEQMLLGFLDQPRENSNWCKHGGHETLRSYGIATTQTMLGRGYDTAAETLSWAMPPHHLDYLKSLRLGVMTERFFFCHAGVKPGVALDEQRVEDLLWIREEFLNSAEDFGRYVVHGHTVVPAVDIRPNRINIDTGAYDSGQLTCLVVEDADMFLLTSPET